MAKPDERPSRYVVCEVVCESEGHNLTNYANPVYKLVCSKCGMTWDEIRGIPTTEAKGA